MSEYQASRTLVKSPPELWAECSDARSLARHLGEDVGEIRIRRLEPETTVAWEGERISGTVRLEPSGWGTKVTLTAAAAGEESEPVQSEEPEPVQVEEPRPVQLSPPEPPAASTPELSPSATPLATAEEPPQKGFGARFRRWFGSRPAAVPGADPVPVDPPAPVAVPASVEAPAPAPEPVAVGAQPSAETPPSERRTDPVDLTAALDSLGKAHHRPFSRA